MANDNTPSLIEVLNSNGSQPWQRPENFGNSIYSGYKFSKSLNCWLWCRVSGDFVSMHYYKQGKITGYIEVAQWDKQTLEWTYTNDFDRIGESLGKWVKAVCKRSITNDRTQKASVKFDQRNLVGLAAAKWFKKMYKQLNTTENKIRIAKQLKPGVADQDLFEYNGQTGEVNGVIGISRYEMLNAYLVDAFSNNTEFSDLQAWNLPHCGIFTKRSNKK